MNIEIQGKNVLITGANRGIGKSLAEAMLEQGAAKLYAAVRNPDSAKPLVEQYGDKVVPLELDLTKPDTIQAAASAAGDVDIVINNGGVLKKAGPLEPEAIENFKTEFDVNVLGLMRMAQAFAPALKTNGGGAFVQLNSVASLRSFPPFATYAASKAASYSITQALREFLGEQGTHVVSVHPGPIDTDMAQQAGLDGEPPSVVVDAVIDALKNETFHVFPDSTARDMWQAYKSFATEVIEPKMAEA